MAITRCYGIAVSPLYHLKEACERAPLDPAQVVDAFPPALNTILEIDRRIASKTAPSVAVTHFEPLLESLQCEAVAGIRREFEFRIRDGDTQMSEFANELSRSGWPAEAVAMVEYIEAGPKRAKDSAKTDLEVAKIVTDSGKDLVKKYLKWKWIEAALKTINEILSIFIKLAAA